MKNNYLNIFSSIYGKLVGFNRKLYETGFLASHRLPVPVVSVGNITWGGTGKTPFVLYLSEYFLNRGKKVVVLSRGYGGKLSRTFGVVTPGALPGEVGDEPLFMRKIISSDNFQVVVGKNRIKSGRLAVSFFHPDVIILDDGFSHVRLKRDIDIVLFDALNPLGNKRLIPAGILREPLSSLYRANIFFVNREDLLHEDEKIDYLYNELNTFNNPVFHISYKIISMESVNGEERYNVSDFPCRDVIPLTAIGSPDSFDRILKKNGFRFTDRITYRDHHRFNEKDLNDIVRRWKKSKKSAVVITQKDMIKLAPLFKGLAIPVYSVNIKTVFNMEDEESEFISIIEKVVSND